MTPFQLEHTAALLADILTFRQPADILLNIYFRKHRTLGAYERREVTETVFTVIRHYQKISAVLPCPHAEPRKATLAALILGRGIDIDTVQNLLDKTESEFLHVLKSRKNELADKLNTAAELPEWLIGQMRQNGHNPHNILAFGRSVNISAPLDLRVNVLKGRRDKILAVLNAEGYCAQAVPYSPWGIRLYDKVSLSKHPLFLDGVLEVQDEGSQLLALLLGAKRGETVVDFCAGAGGKTLAIGAMMANKGRIYAFDIAANRLANLKPRMVRAGLNNIHIQRLSSETDLRIARLKGKACRVLVDAPCTGLGTLRRNPDLKYRHSPETLNKLTEQQYRILKAAAVLVKPYGYLLYATCSVLAEENERQIERFLAEHVDFELCNAAGLLAAAKINLNTGNYLYLDTARHNTDGFFAAVMRRKA